MSDTRILQVTWAETGVLVALSGTKEALQRLQAIVGRFVAKAIANGELDRFAAPARLPAIGEPGHDVAAAMQDVVKEAADTGQFNGAKLPPRAVLWEVTPDGAPRNAEPALPPGCDWVPSAATRRSDFKAPDGRYFRLYESDVIAPPGLPDWVSGFTKSGLPTEVAAKRRWALPAGLGVVAAILFFWLMASLGWSGRTVALAYETMAVKAAARGSFVSQLLANCRGNNKCEGENGQPISVASSADVEEQIKHCLTITTTTQGKEQTQDAPAMRQSPFCAQAWRGALGFATSAGSRLANRLLGWPISGSAKGGSSGLGLAMAGLMISLLLLGVAAGLAVKGKVFGVLISPQNRFSLSRAQVSAWTIVVLGAYAALTAFNTGMLAHLFQTLDVESIQATNGGPYIFPFPDIPGYLLAALGIAVTSSMASAVLKGDAAVPSLASRTNRAGGGGSGGAGGAGFYWRYLDRSESFPVRGTEAQVSLSDLFTGETQGNTDDVDVSRLQNVIITFILVTGYVSILLGIVRGVANDAVVLALHSSRPIFESLPDPGGTFNVLLLGSQVAYLASKASGGAPTDDQSG